MANAELSLTDLARKGQYNVLENVWLNAIEQPEVGNEDLLEALTVLSKSGKGEQAATLGWTWLTYQKENAEPADVLALARELILRCDDTPELRQEILSLYQEVFADRPELEQLIEASGLSGDKSPLRALRTMEICLGLKVGDFLISRRDESVAKVKEIDTDLCEYTIETRRGEDTLDPDSLALTYDPVSENDFRVLTQMHPDRIAELVAKNPVALIVGILQSHHDRIDSDELEERLCPQFISHDNWASWWSKARSQLRKSQSVVLEGRNPIILTYHSKGRTLESEIEPQWTKARSTAKRKQVIDAYLREGKARQAKMDPKLVNRMHADIEKRVQTMRKRAPAEAFNEALLIDLIAQSGALAENKSRPAREIIAESDDVVRLLGTLTDQNAYVRALQHIKELRPDDWPQLFAELLPVAPIDGCDFIAQSLREAGHDQLVTDQFDTILSDFTKHLDAVCWIYRGGAGTDPIPIRELLTRLLDHLGGVMRSELASADTKRQTREKVRSALAANKYARFRQVIQEMDAGLASTIRTTVQRLDGLGQVVHSDLNRIVLDTHPKLRIVKQKRVDPWDDDKIIFTTRAGYNKREDELKYLRNVKIPENARAIGEAASHGDLSENSEYKFALEERDLLQARAAAISGELAIARTLTANDVNTDTVEIGTRVTLASKDNDFRATLTILGPFDADVERGIYNYRAPMCGKLRHLKVGDTVELDLEGTEKPYRIAAIENALVATPQTDNANASSST